MKQGILAIVGFVCILVGAAPFLVLAQTPYAWFAPAVFYGIILLALLARKRSAPPLPRKAPRKIEGRVTGERANEKPESI